MNNMFYVRILNEKEYNNMRVVRLFGLIWIVIVYIIFLILKVKIVFVIE